MRLEFLDELKGENGCIVQFGKPWLDKFVLPGLLTTILLLIIIILPAAILELIPTNLNWLRRNHKVRDIIRAHETYLNSSEFNSQGYYLKDHNDSHLIVTHTNIEGFISGFISQYNERYDTYRKVDDHHICYNQRRRSLGDIYLICKHYFPTCTMEEVLKILIKLMRRGEISGGRCNDIRKYVWTTNRRSGYVGWDSKTEYGTDLKMNEITNYYNI